MQPTLFFVVVYKTVTDRPYVGRTVQHIIALGLYKRYTRDPVYQQKEYQYRFTRTLHLIRDNHQNHPFTAMQKKQYMDQRSISPVLEATSYKDKGRYLKDGDNSTLEMFNQLIISSNKIAADADTSEESLSGENNDGVSVGEASDNDEDKENCDPNHEDSTLTNEPIVRGRPSSCVFVASLCSNKSDDELCVSVTAHFAQWGKLATVKVLRDPSNRPYAFVQYTNDKDSKNAIANGHNSILDGRSLRCEAAKVNRTLFVSSKFLKNEKPFKEMLQEFGEVEQLIPSDEFGKVKSSKYHVKSSKHWFCKYVFRDDAIRAFANLSENASSHVEWAQNIETFSSNSTGTNNHAKDDDFKMKFDKLSVFVGQLNPLVTEDELVNRFKRHGQVDEATIVKKTSNTFGFIKYKDESSAASAVERENHSMFKDKTMHVQYREVHPNSNKNSVKNTGIALAPPPINLKKRQGSGAKKIPEFRKMSPFNHHLYPMPIPIPTKKNFNNLAANNQIKGRVMSNPYHSNPFGKRKYSKFGESYDKFKAQTKEDSPTPPESVQTYDSHTITKSGYSPSSAVNSERSEFLHSGEGAKNPKAMNPKNKNVPYFYYIPTNEVAPSSSSGYYNPYQYFIPYETSPEYQQQNGYGIPFPMYYPPSNDQEFNFEESFETPT